MRKPLRNRSVLFILPAILVVGGSTFIPLLAVVNYSLQDVFYANDFIWVGPKWFVQVLGSREFYHTLLRTFAFSAIVMAIEVPLGILVALSLPRKGKMVPVYIMVVAIPLMIPWVVVGLMWLLLIHPQWGSFGALLSLAGLKVDINNLFGAWGLIIFVDIWHWTSLVVLLCYSGLLAIPDRYYQAASIDGANRWNLFRHVELPQIKRVLMIALLLRFLDDLCGWCPFRHLDQRIDYLALECGTGRLTDAPPALFLTGDEFGIRVSLCGTRCQVSYPHV